jgi:CheY-like chemotaxis protein
MRRLAERRPDILISDIGMPGEDGYSLIRRVRGLSPTNGGDVPAVALTAYARREDVVRAEASGFHIHIAKPIAVEELVAAIKSCLR